MHETNITKVKCSLPQQLRLQNVCNVTNGSVIYMKREYNDCNDRNNNLLLFFVVFTNTAFTNYLLFSHLLTVTPATLVATHSFRERYQSMKAESKPATPNPDEEVRNTFKTLLDAFAMQQQQKMTTTLQPLDNDHVALYQRSCAYDLNDEYWDSTAQHMNMLCKILNANKCYRELHHYANDNLLCTHYVHLQETHMSSYL